ncbi:aminotransferase class I/II-fold pyridoxal phosphate-dependent enzyme [Desulfolucanica intricata]|uniref:aminotransferase class I/II-fold pyridoxal phosphate-dependent enzyme n=1 Tax=Desulfolucanica intricata TaxID=1285191 RepID=UPI000A86CBFF|nr:aminotransferase class I/II-fold pyridoxal phosphate-dependent enzyme [Desulfolucanica intricata]
MVFSKQKKLPLFDAIAKYSNGAANLHVPAHRQGFAAPDSLVNFAGQNIFKLDLTEIYGLDDLHNPQGVIAEAQKLAAQLYGADYSFFLVNGTTCGLQALIMSVCSSEEKIIVPRNVHRSVLAGLIFSGADPIYIIPEVMPEFNFLVGFLPDKLKVLLKRYPEIKAAMAVYPTYYGVGGDLEDIAKLLHDQNKPLLVDEAHGAHLAFHHALPPQALDVGADAVVQSTHKLGGALTQASMLHLKGKRVDPGRVAQALKLVQTTSPSYILMASLDTSRRQLALTGHDLLNHAILLADYTKQLLQEIEGLKILTPDFLNVPGADFLDPTRLVINVAQTGLTGYRVADLLAIRYNVHIEMADPLNLIVPVTIGTTEQDCLSLVEGLKNIVQTESGVNFDKAKLQIFIPDLPEKEMLPREAWFAGHKKVLLSEAAGEVSAEWLAVYPPGIPVLFPGELITNILIDYLQQIKAAGLRTQGLEDSSLTTIKVVDKN